MLNWITANLSTIVISAILLAIVTSISLHLIRQKKQGRSSCGCNCASRPGAGRPEDAAATAHTAPCTASATVSSKAEKAASHETV